MTATDPFEEHADRYEEWFESYEAAYRSELDALRRFITGDEECVEIGVGTGRFAAPLGVGVGVDPAGGMLRRADECGVEPVRGVAEALPFGDATFDTALVVTTLCFLDDVSRALREARRVLRPGGQFVVGLLDEDSAVGQQYLARADESPFYRDASFVSTEDLLAELETTGFGNFETVQTVFEMPGELDEPDSARDGYGDGVFVVVRAVM